MPADSLEVLIEFGQSHRAICTRMPADCDSASTTQSCSFIQRPPHRLRNPSCATLCATDPRIDVLMMHNYHIA